MTAQAMAGVVSIQGSWDGSLALGVAWVDKGTGIMIAYATVLALLVRERTGMGQEVNTSFLDVCVSMQALQMGDYLIDGNCLVNG